MSSIQAVLISGAKFTGNIASVGVGGGASLKSDVSVTVLGTIFERDHAEGKGGGLALDVSSGDPLLVSAGKFFDNVSKVSGGGVALIGTEAGKILKSLVTGNVATVSGGGIFNDTPEVADLSGTKATGNFAPLGPNILETSI